MTATTLGIHGGGTSNSPQHPTGEIDHGFLRRGNEDGSRSQCLGVPGQVANDDLSFGGEGGGEQIADFFSVEFEELEFDVEFKGLFLLVVGVVVGSLFGCW